MVCLELSQMNELMEARAKLALLEKQEEGLVDQLCAIRAAVQTQRTEVEGLIRRIPAPINDLGFRTGNTVGQNLDTVPVPADTVPATGTGTHRPVDTTVSPPTPRQLSEHRGLRVPCTG